MKITKRKIIVTAIVTAVLVFIFWAFHGLVISTIRLTISSFGMKLFLLSCVLTCVSFWFYDQKVFGAEKGNRRERYYGKKQNRSLFSL